MTLVRAMLGFSILLGFASAAFAQPKASAPSFASDVAPLLNKYCITCHGANKPKAGLNLERFKDEPAALKEKQLWVQVQQVLQSSEMPPKSKPQPTLAEKDCVQNWINSRVLQTDGAKDPGRVTIRRLNRAEYNNTIRDLLGVALNPADDFPSDDVGYGFDNIGDVLSLSPLLLEKYLAAADKVVSAAMRNTESRRKIVIFLPTQDAKEESARRILENFARRAYRRPVGGEEVGRLVKLVHQAEEQGEDFYEGLKLALKAILVSPHFLFRVELDTEPHNPKAVHPVTDYELANRLSYFLWSSMPDEELFSIARKGALRRDDTLEAQVRRMLKDPRSKSLVDNFAGQWLQLRSLKTATPDPGMFPRFDDSLRTAMQRETELFFEHVLREDRPVTEFVDSDYTFLNERLAQHYGIDGVKGNEFRKVSLKDSPRGGVLTQASVLTVTSNPTRTSPVKRGKYVLENLLGTPPPPPPPDAPELKEDKELKGSLRQRMEQHRADPNCATCHQRMDPLGFGLENFDAIGGWRVKEGAFQIDPSGTLPNGRSFQGPRDLKKILLADKQLYCRCLSEKMLTYALGRGMEYYDKAALDAIGKKLASGDGKFSTLVLEIVKSDSFQKRRGHRGDQP